MFPPTRPSRLPIRRSRRAITFVEVLCAAALLAIVVAGIFGGLGFMMAQQQRLHHRLASAELANRLMLQYLDDEDTLPKAGLPIAYDQNMYRWDLKETPVRLEPARPDKAAERAAAVANSGRTVTSDRLVAVAIRVWLSEESGGNLTPEGGVPGVQLSRIVDPLAITRNPDSLDNTVRTPDKLQKFLSRVQSGQGGQPARPAPKGGRSDTRPPPSKPSAPGKGAKSP